MLVEPAYGAVQQREDFSPSSGRPQHSPFTGFLRIIVWVKPYIHCFRFTNNAINSRWLFTANFW